MFKAVPGSALLGMSSDMEDARQSGESRRVGANSIISASRERATLHSSLSRSSPPDLLLRRVPAHAPRAMSTAAAPALPSLLPQKRTYLELEAASATQWKPTRYLEPPQPPPQDDAKQREIEMATARQLMDGKALKRIRPRRTVDYGGSMGRWELVRDESQRALTGVDDLQSSFGNTVRIRRMCPSCDLPFPMSSTYGPFHFGVVHAV
jgi:hypothetical protein